jgi:CARDB
MKHITCLSLLVAAMQSFAAPPPDSSRLPGAVPRDPFLPPKAHPDLLRVRIPDLVVSRAKVTEYRSNRTWQVDYCVKNIGDAATAAEFRVRFANHILGDAPIFPVFAGMRGFPAAAVPLPGVAPGEERCGQFSFFIPEFEGRTDFFSPATNARVVVDFTSVIRERREDNNATPVAFRSVF